MFSHGLSSLKKAASTETRFTCRRTRSASVTTSQPKDARCPGVRREQRAEDPDQGRLAAAVRPEDAGDSARFDLQVELVERHLGLRRRSFPEGRAGFALAAPKRFAYPLDIDRGNVHHRLLKPGWTKEKGPARCPTTARSLS